MKENMIEVAIINLTRDGATLRPTWDLVREDVRRMFDASNNTNPDFRDAVRDAVLADMTARDRIGRERYGTPLTAKNGRDHIVDAYQEALDLAVYLRNELEERPDEAAVGAFYWTAMTLVVRLRGTILAPELADG